MKSRKAYFLDASYTIRDGKTYVTLLLKGKKAMKLYYQHDPYFYVEAPLERVDDLLKVYGRRKNGEVAAPKKVDVVEVDIGTEKKKLAKVYCNIPQDVPVIKSAMPFRCYEYNIPFARRFIFDFKLTPLHIIKYQREKQIIKKIILVHIAPLYLLYGVPHL